MLIAEPPVVSREPNNSKVEEGGEVELECEVRGTPTPNVLWLLNGEPLDNDTHAHIRGITARSICMLIFGASTINICSKYVIFVIK